MKFTLESTGWKMHSKIKGLFSPTQQKTSKSFFDAIIEFRTDCKRAEEIKSDGQWYIFFILWQKYAISVGVEATLIIFFPSLFLLLNFYSRVWANGHSDWNHHCTENEKKVGNIQMHWNNKGKKNFFCFETKDLLSTW